MTTLSLPTITEIHPAASNHFSNPRKLADKLCRRVDVDKKTGCWLWKGHLNKLKTGYSRGGYGLIYFEDRTITTHRASFLLVHGYPPDGGEVGHIAKCPNKHCCNPAHLVGQTHAENMAQARGKTHKATGNVRKLSKEQVCAVRVMRDIGLLNVRATAKRMGVDPAVIRRAAGRKSYVNVA
jgi:hypothetical protein